MQSALATVDRRCAIISTVLPLASRAKAACTLASLSGSAKAVASSRIRMGGYYDSYVNAPSKKWTNRNIFAAGVNYYGEIRTSNFLLWQSAYAEYYFTDVLWPDFKPADMDAAIDEFNRRNRRFGGV